MPYSNMRKTGQRVATLAMMVGASSIAGCDDGVTPPPVVFVDVVATIDATNVAALNDKTFTFANGSAVDPVFAGIQIAVTFSNISGGAGQFSLVSSAGDISGDLTIGSCVLTVTASTVPGFVVPQTITIASCGIGITAASVTAGFDANGNITLTFGNTSSGQVPAQVSVDPTTGQVSVDGTPTGATVTVTGSTGGTE